MRCTEQGTHLDANVTAARIFPLAQARNGCPHCGFSEWSFPARLTSAESRYLHEQVVHGRRVKRHEYMHRAGSALASLNVINSGCLKTSMTDRDGHVQVTGFSMRGEMVGLDAIGSGFHQCDTIALQDTQVCGIGFSSFEQLAHDIPALQRQFNQTMGAEITRDHNIMFVLGAMRAEERVAMFLLNLSKRFAARGCSALQFRLPMQRQEIGNYLGLKLETISRALSHLQALEVIAIKGKDIELRNVCKLQQTIKI